MNMNRSLYMDYIGLPSIGLPRIHMLSVELTPKRGKLLALLFITTIDTAICLMVYALFW